MNAVNKSRARLLKHIERAALLACVLLLVPISAAAQDTDARRALKSGSTQKFRIPAIPAF